MSAGEREAGFSYWAIALRPDADLAQVYEALRPWLSLVAVQEWERPRSAFRLNICADHANGLRAGEKRRRTRLGDADATVHYHGAHSGCILCENRRLQQRIDGLATRLKDATSAIATARAMLDQAAARVNL